jgi:hypothetical protein
MFYSEDQIESVTKCLKCDNLFVDDARLLPCGHRICNSCIKNHLNKNKFKCFNCDKKHSMPKNGFPICKLMASLLEEQSKCTFDIHQSLKDEINKMGINCNQLKSKYDLIHSTISNNFDFVLNENHLETFEESRHEKQLKIAETFYKRKLQQNEEIINEVNRCYRQFSDLLVKYSIGENLVCMRFETAILSNHKIESYIKIANEDISHLNKLIKSDFLLSNNKKEKLISNDNDTSLSSEGYFPSSFEENSSTSECFSPFTSSAGFDTSSECYSPSSPCIE